MTVGLVRHAPRKTLSATVVAGRYQLDRELARGGMGTVWLARDQKLGRAVAVKVMAQELAQMSEALHRFEREAMALAGLRSTHVVEVYDYGVQEGLPYIVMELLEGENLGQRLKRIPQLGLWETNHLVSQMCRGLKAAHTAKLIHRDLKPSNIFIARQDDAELIKLLDFGVVKALDPSGSSDATMTGVLLGTPQYMSPEQARATGVIDHRSDLWSVGVIAFRMLTGQNPFRGESVGDVVLRICSDALPRISEHRSDLSPVLNEFFDRAFERDPNQRFQSATELATAFDDVVRRALGPAAPPPRPPMTSLVDATPPPLGAFPEARAPHLSSAPSLAGALAPMKPGPGVSASSPLEANPAELGSSPMGSASLTPGPWTPASAPPTTGQPAPAPTALLVSSPTDPAPPTAAPPPGPRASLASLSGLGAASTSGEHTPISTTVGGTQLAPKIPALPPHQSGRAVAFIVGGAALLLTLGLVVAVWVGSDDGAQASPAAASSASPHGDYTSNDDDGPGLDPDPVEDGAETADAPEGLTPEAPPDAPETTASAAAKVKAKDPKARGPAAVPATPRPRTPEPAPEPKPKGRPDWGLGEDG